MSLSPYLFEPKILEFSPFERMIADHKTWYFWAQILETGTAVCHTTISTIQDGMTYFLVDPSLDNYPCIAPEEFIEIVAGREENGLFFGYTWTIKKMANNWHRLLYMRCEDNDYSVNDYALKINYGSEELDIVSKVEVWKSIEEIRF